jgi:hypothetical protein
MKILQVSSAEKFLVQDGIPQFSISQDSESQDKTYDNRADLGIEGPNASNKELTAMAVFLFESKDHHFQYNMQLDPNETKSDGNKELHINVDDEKEHN